MTFKERYLELKAQNKTDNEVAVELGVCRDTITRWKKIHGITYRKTKKNRCNIPESSIQKAVQNGISRRLFLRRIREYGFSEYEAIHTPRNKRKEQAGVSEEQWRMRKSERQRDYYINTKRKVLRG